MNRVEELRQQMVQAMENNIAEFEDGGNPELDGDFVTIDYVTAKRTLELLKRLEVPVEAKWHYYTNEEGKPRWRCTNCGRLCKRNPYDKKRCSTCGAYTTLES